jgi:signal transduction histidine kinase
MRVGIRAKLGMALAVPLTALGVVAALEVTSATADANEVRRQADIATAALGPQGLVNALHAEASIGAAYAGGVEDSVDLPVDDYGTARELTDAARHEFGSVVDRSGAAVRSTYGPALAALDALDAPDGVRARVDGITGPRGLGVTTDLGNEVFESYSQLIDRLLIATTQISSIVRDPVLRHGAALIADAARAQAAESDVIRSLVLGQLSAGGLDTPTDQSWAGRAVGTLDTRLHAIERRATAGYGPAVERLFATERLQRLRSVAHESLPRASVDIPAVLDVAADQEGEGFERFKSEVTGTLLDRAQSLRADASGRQRRYTALALVAFGGTGVLTWVVARSITRPLRALTGAARHVATQHLPAAVADILATPPGADVRLPAAAPIEVRSRDEVADVAEALGDVQTTALDLAVGQAALRRNLADAFVNLGRRNQALLTRQLALITDLEANETDPDALADLFQLDHMATRMRRNAESLLVLGGLRASRTWTAPVPLDAVLRAALGEIEDYTRVAWRSVEPALVDGSIAADLTHLLAELLENAVAASPPGHGVEVTGHSQPDGYSLAIADLGPGMSDADVEQANRRLRGDEPYTTAPSRYLGHYVAGQLAGRHGIRLAVDGRRSRGLTATVELPGHLVGRGADRLPAWMAQPAGAPVPHP